MVEPRFIMERHSARELKTEGAVLAVKLSPGVPAGRRNGF
jgi:hypothetical protein